jgi:hypothetical protein
MSEAAKTARNAMRAKAKRLTSADPNEKVDSSSWSPAPLLEADKKTGARPLVKRLYKKGGKVVGKAEGKKAEFRADRKPRKSGGKAEHKAPWVDDLINRDVRMANDKREGVKHDGAFKKGGKAHKADGGRMLSPYGEKVKRLAEIKKLQLQSNPKTTDKNQWGDWHQERSRLESDLMDASRRLGPTRKEGGRAKKFGGGPIGMNPVGQQNQMMGKAAGMMKKGGKVHRKHRDEGGDAIGELIKRTPDPLPRGMAGRGQPTNLAPMYHMPADNREKPNKDLPAQGMTGAKRGGKTDGHKVGWLHHAKGGKTKHSDEAQDKKLMHKLLKEKAFKASGGKAMHHKDCLCKMCMGGRMGKYSGGGVFDGNSKQKVPGVVPGGRMAKAGGGESSGPDFSGAYYDLFSGWHNLDKANPDQIAAMRPEDRAKAYEAQGNAPVRMGATPNTSTSTTYRSRKPISKMVGSGRGVAGPTAADIAVSQNRYNPYAGMATDDMVSGNELLSQNRLAKLPPTPVRVDQNYGMPGVRQGGAGEPAIVFGNPSGMENDPSSYAARERAFVQQQNQRLRDSMDSTINSDLTPRPGQRPMDTSERSYGLTPEQEDALPRKSGGRAKGKTNVNIVIATGKGQQPTGMMGGAPMPNAPVSPRIPQQAGQPPMGPQGMPPMPPQGMPMPPQGMPMGRKTGGRAYPIDTGSGGANARLEKIDAYGLKPTRGRK